MPLYMRADTTTCVSSGDCRLSSCSARTHARVSGARQRQVRRPFRGVGRRLGAPSQRGTQFTFALLVQKVSEPPLNEVLSLLLLYWYKSTNTDADGGYLARGPLCLKSSTSQLRALILVLQVTCFTGTKVHILTQLELYDRHRLASHSE